MYYVRAMFIIETERLGLRELSLADLDQLHAIFADPEMMRFYPAPFTRERTEGWIAWAMRGYAERGHGLWAVERKADGLLLGDCGIVAQQIEGQELLEIGYHIRRDQWGQGYATEAARACRDYAFAQLGAQQICSIVDPLNLASRAVAGRVHSAMREFIWQKNNAVMCLYYSKA
jgi:ribosomal-protein-alanine N-acetyltransferase